MVARRRHDALPPRRARAHATRAADVPLRRAVSPSRRTSGPSRARAAGTKWVVGDGPARAELERRYPDVRFVGAKTGGSSRVLPAGGRFRLPEPHRHLRARAARGDGVRHAGRGLSGARPIDVVDAGPSGVLDKDLRAAALAALELDRASRAPLASNRHGSMAPRNSSPTCALRMPDAELRREPLQGQDRARRIIHAFFYSLSGLDSRAATRAPSARRSCSRWC